MSAKVSSVLIVDDDKALAQVVAVTPRSAGFEVCTAHGGIQGYVAYLRYPTDWVLSDIQMPILNGLGMMRCIRAVNPGVQTLCMRGALDQFRAVLDHESAQFGAKCLRKPFARTELIELLTGCRENLAHAR